MVRHPGLGVLWALCTHACNALGTMSVMDETGNVLRAALDVLPREAGVTRRGFVVGAGLAGRALPWREWLSSAAGRRCASPTAPPAEATFIGRALG